jgi:hypothetical protein
MEKQNITLDDINTYLEKTGKRGAMIMSVIGTLEPSYHAIIGTEIGREILKSDMMRLDELLPKIYEQTATQEEMIEFRYLRGRVSENCKKIKTYLEMIGRIKKVAEE